MSPSFLGGWSGPGCADDVELAADPLLVESPQESADRVRCQSGTPPRHAEPDRLASTSRIRRSEQRRRTIAASVVRDGELQPRLAPTVVQRPLDPVEIVDECQGPEHKLSGRGQAGTERD